MFLTDWGEEISDWLEDLKEDMDEYWEGFWSGDDDDMGGLYDSDEPPF